VKRHPALVALSHDHHHGLVQASRLRRGAEAGDPLTAARAFLRFFEQETVAHFREEEERLFPLVAALDEARDALTRALFEHQRIHALVARLDEQLDAGAPEAALMAELASLLEAHIRYEERELFPLIERLLPELQLLRAADTTGRNGPIWGIESEELNATVLAWAAGQRTPEHINDERDVLVVVLEGSAEIVIGERRSSLRSGDAVIVPKGTSRQVTAGRDGVRYLSVHRRRGPLQISRVG